ncbi:hypothetical protein LCGC14_0245350 [marine sediment metagenome]|uniref:Uncharacterized protein n=1 Tax=marine sediment metagenome TaxID=412755 RepID=A0A0F9UAG3_9ZZZZ
MAHIVYTDHGSVPAAIVPYNLNERAFIGFTNHIKGAPKLCPYIKAEASDPAKWDDANYEPVLVGGEPVDPDYLPPYRTAPGLIDLHPNVLEKNNSATVQEGFDITIYTLRKDPRFITYGEITESNYREYWSEVNRVSPQGETEYQFAEEYDGSLNGWPDSGMPPYDFSILEYPAIGESLWEDIEDTQKHRWYRYRTAYYDNDGDQQVSDWHPPIPIGRQPGLFVKVKNIFIRNGLKADGLDVSDMPATPPPITTLGAPNNSPAGWEDNFVTTPVTDWLWVSRALIDVEGNINTQVGWSQPAVVSDDENLTRFHVSGEPHPKTIVDTTTDASDSSQGDTDLVSAGWVQPLDFDVTIHFYIATRVDLEGGTYTEWKVERLTNEQEDIVVTRYKLLPLVADWDDPTWVSNNRPVGVDPSDQGWVVDLQTETNFLVNYISIAILYANRTIKSNWSDPRPYTSKDTYNDYISIHPDDGGNIDDTEVEFNVFRSSFTGGAESHDPENIWFRAQLILGLNDLVDDATIAIAYVWKKTYDGGAQIPTPPTAGTNQDIKINYSDVTGRAIYEVTMTLSDAGGSTAIADAIAAGIIDSEPEWVEQMSITDMVDGLDGRTLSFSAHPASFIKDGVGSPYEYLPTRMGVTVVGDNIDYDDLEYYLLDAGGDITDDNDWIQITAETNNRSSTPKSTWFEGSILWLAGGFDDVASTDMFSATNERYVKAVIPASGSLAMMEDWTIVTLLDPQSIGAGENGITINIDDPSQQVKVDEAGVPISGEFDFIFNIRLTEGSTIKAASTYTCVVETISGALSSGENVAITNVSDDKRVTVDNTVVPSSVTITRASTTATVTHTTHGLVTGNKVVIAGANESDYNGTFVITYVDTNTYTYTVSGSPATPATGTITSSNILWDNTQSNGKCAIYLKITYSGADYYRFIMLTSVLEPYGFRAVEITSDRGTFTFDYSTDGSNDIVLTATVNRYADGAPQDDSGSFSFQWSSPSGVYTGSFASVQEQTVTRADVTGSCVMRCTATNGPIVYTQDVRINDVPDNRLFLLYSTEPLTPSPNPPGLDFDQYPSGEWTNVATNAIWVSENYNGGLTGSWSLARRIGNNYVEVYSTAVSQPAQASGTYDTFPAGVWAITVTGALWYCRSFDYGNNWEGPFPVAQDGSIGTDGNLWYTMQGVVGVYDIDTTTWVTSYNTSDDYILASNGAGTPGLLAFGAVDDLYLFSDGAIFYKTLHDTGTPDYRWKWTGYNIKGADGNGDNGWGPEYELVSDGARRVLRLVAWVGGTGDTPTTNIGKYVGDGGMFTDVADGIDIRGATGPGYDNVTDGGEVVTGYKQVTFEGVNGANDKIIQIPNGITGGGVTKFVFGAKVFSADIEANHASKGESWCLHMDTGLISGKFYITGSVRLNLSVLSGLIEFHLYYASTNVNDADWADASKKIIHQDYINDPIHSTVVAKEIAFTYVEQSAGVIVPLTARYFRLVPYSASGLNIDVKRITMKIEVIT